MSLLFKKYFSLAIIFNKDLNKVYLKNINGKLDAFLIESNVTGKAVMVELSEKINSLTNLMIKPEDWRNVISLHQIDKSMSTTVVSSFIDAENMKDVEVFDVDNLPSNMIPSLKWLIPLCLDVCIIGSNYNQVIIR